MGVIRKLDPHLVNQIAAGEVIERPASVVKELLENAIDAQAAHIDVAIEDGGKKLIRVQDDGLGMAADDLALAVASHATSKLTSSDDLERIATLGFRGEALASVGSVSQMVVTSCRAGEVGGHSISIDGGRLGDLRAAGAAPGTTVEVRNLFHTIPARRKFLKTEATELGHIVDAMARVALAYPQVAFRLTHNGRTVHNLPRAEDIRERVSAFFGRQLADQLIEIRSDTPVGGLWGLAAPPSESRASTRMQYLFVNGRYVRDRSLLHAIREAYRGLIESNRQPVVFLYLTVPANDIDVNVHPTKIEVRLRSGQQLYREVLAALRQRFLTADLAPRIEDGLALPAGRTADNAPPHAESGAGDTDAQAREMRIRQSMADFLRAPPSSSQQRLSFKRGDRGTGPSGPREFASPVADTEPPPGDLQTAPSPQRAPVAQGVEDAGPRAVQLHNTYLVAETDDGILIVDQHALHERVIYEELRSRLGAGPLESQRLLIPAVLDVTQRERAFLEEHGEQLARLGVEFEPFGTASIGIQAFPMMLTGRAQPERVLRDLLDWAAENGGKLTVDDVLDELLHRMACRAAVKAGDVLTAEEVQSLLAKRHMAEQTATCPHGRPTSLVLPRDEIERQFHRDYRTTRPEDDDTLPPDA